MTRYTVPTPTRGHAPSHSPPDVVYAPGNRTAQGLAWFSLGLGLAEFLAPEAVAKLSGVPHPRLLRLSGLREMACGLGIITSPRPAGWLWGRVAGDMMDLATLTSALLEADGRRGRVLASLAAVAGVTALDVLSGSMMTAGAALASPAPPRGATPARPRERQAELAAS